MTDRNLKGIDNTAVRVLALGAAAVMAVVIYVIAHGVLGAPPRLIGVISLVGANVIALTCAAIMVRRNR